MGIGGQPQAPVALPPGKTRYPFIVGWVGQSTGLDTGKSRPSLRLDPKCGKGLPQQTEMVRGVPARLRPRIFLTFGTTRAVGRQPYTPSAFTPGEIPGTHF